MAISNTDIITQRQQARKSYFYNEDGARKADAKPAKASEESKSSPDYKVSISDSARSAAVEQSASKTSAKAPEATQQKSPEASRLAELKAQSDAVMNKYTPKAEVKTETSTDTKAAAPEAKSESSEAAAEAKSDAAPKGTAPEKSGDFISKRQAARQEFFHPGEKQKEFSYDRNSKLDELKAKSDAIIKQKSTEIV